MRYDITLPAAAERLTEETIFVLQDALLQPGTWTIQATSYRDAQRVFRRFCQFLSIKCSYIAYITSDTTFGDDCNLGATLSQFSESDDSIEQFLLESFYADIIWIEQTPQLVSKSWYKSCIAAINKFQFDKSCSILMVQANENS